MWNLLDPSDNLRLKLLCQCATTTRFIAVFFLLRVCIVNTGKQLYQNKWSKWLLVVRGSGAMEGESVQTRSFLQPAEEEERSQQSGGNIFHLLQLSGSALPWPQGSLLTKPLFSYDVCNSVLSVKALVGAFSGICETSRSPVDSSRVGPPGCCRARNLMSYWSQSWVCGGVVCLDQDGCQPRWLQIHNPVHDGKLCKFITHNWNLYSNFLHTFTISLTMKV